jgi:carlactone synthase/all-trans-10'-apo-beta-carotenal 13,14-cleaving dioxygenase
LGSYLTWIADLCDAGVAISMVSAKDGSGYALVLDAKTFQEVARAKFPYGLPYGLHCCWVPRGKVT